MNPTDDRDWQLKANLIAEIFQYTVVWYNKGSYLPTESIINLNVALKRQLGVLPNLYQAVFQYILWVISDIT